MNPNHDFRRKALLSSLLVALVFSFAVSATAQSLTPLDCPLDGHFWEPEGLTVSACINACTDPYDHDSSGCSAGPGGGGGGGIGGGGPPPGIGGGGKKGGKKGGSDGGGIVMASSPSVDNGCCGSGDGGSGGGDDECCEGGMARWSVAQPRLNVFVGDKPFWYQPSRGREVAFHLSFKNKQGVNGAIDNGQSLIFSVGTNWHTPWRSYIQAYTAPGSYGTRADHYVFAGDGTAMHYKVGHIAHDSLARLTDEEEGLVLTYPSGARKVYGTNITVGGTALYFLSQSEDSEGHPLRFQYIQTNGVVRLNKVIDLDGRETTFEYVTNNHYHLISKVAGPYGLTNILQYNAQAQLTNIVDTLGMSSKMEYDASNRISGLITPYGTNNFGYYSGTNWTGLRVTEYNVRKHFYLTGDGPTNLFPSASSQISSLTTFLGGLPVGFDATNDLHLRTSFYWGPAQYLALSTNVTVKLDDATFDFSHVSTSDFNKGWTKRYLFKSMANINDRFMGRTVSMERRPSPNSDGSTEGLYIWYGHARMEGGEDEEGTQPVPISIAYQLSATAWYVEEYERYWNSNPTEKNVTIGYPGSASWHSTIFDYDTANKVDLTADDHTGSTWDYNHRHQVTNHVNGVGEQTVYAYDSNNGYRLSSITRHNGLITSNFYNGDGFVSSVVDGNGSVNFRTNAYTYTNGLVYTHTDERGLTITNVYDNFGRLTNRLYPDGTGITNIYDKLDLVQIIDRMGFTNSFEYNRFRQVVREIGPVRSQIDPLRSTNSFVYCDCGSLNSTIDPMGNTNSFTYDNTGRRTRVTHPGGSYTDFVYDGPGRVIRTTDNAGVGLTNWYTFDSLVFAQSNSAGRVFLNIFDEDGRVKFRMDQNGTIKGFAYDILGRMTAKTNYYGDSDWPPDPVFDAYTWELFTYTVGFSAPTLHEEEGYAFFPTTEFNYDLLQRKTNEVRYTMDGTTPLTTNTFSYSPAGDLLTLTDAKNQTTTWKYDLYGRVTNKLDAANAEMFSYAYDANGRLTNRWTPAKGTTRYVYDNAGNLTQVDYPASTDITLGYDANNRLTSISDASGSSAFTYTAFGALLSEDGPWSDDTVTYSYTANRLRSGLSLQQLNAPAWGISYAYDAANRLTNITSAAGAFGYQYDPGLHSGIASAASLVRKISLPGGAAITNIWDTTMGRLGTTKLLNSSGTVLNSHAYDYDDFNRRRRQTRVDGSYVDYTYDDLGQLTGASGKESEGTTNRWHEQLSYTYDGAGNLLHRTNHSLVQSFGVNNLNQLTNQSRSGRMSVAGTSSSAATNVTVNTTNAIRYADHTFVSTNHTLANGSNTFTAIAQDSLSRSDTHAVSAYLPDSGVFVYDSNGNMVYDGQKAFDYDDENQLIRITATNQWLSLFTYDGKMRRRVRKEYTWRSGVWTLTNEVRYIYDGNLVIQERDQNNIAQVSYTRGKDLSGGLEGAGGIGGLLARTDNGQLTTGSGQSHSYYHADGNGNITMLINAQQVTVAKYIYDPFGGTLSAIGRLAEENLYRFSTKECHSNSRLLYYLYRYYIHSLQRWLNHDPLHELGFAAVRVDQHPGLRPWPFSVATEDIHLYRFVRNDPVRLVDVFGLSCFSDCMDQEAQGLKDFVEDCFCAAGIVGGAAAGGCFTGCVYSTAAYPACVTACLSIVATGGAAASAACTGAALAKATGAIIGCAWGCNF